MLVELGNAAAKTGSTEVVDPKAHSAEALADMAAQAGVDSSGNKEQVAARLSAVVRYEPLDGERVTTIRLPDDISLAEAFVTITSDRGVWASHSDEPATWVACDDSPGLEALLAEHFDCEVGRPADVEDTHHTMHGPPGVGPDEGDDDR